MVCSESYGTESSNKAGEVPCFWAQKYDFLRLIADSERKLIP